jgi:hypothetical protein
MQLSIPSLALVAAGALVALAGCSSDEAATGCSNYFDCEADEACVEGACTAGECRQASDCDDGQDCVASVCVTADASTDADGSGTDSGTPDVGPETDTDIVADTVVAPDIDVTPDLGIDTSDVADVDFGPIEFTVVPGDGVLEVPLDARVVVTFNQPMAELTLTPSNLDLTPWQAEGPYPFVNYDPDTYTLTVTSCEGPGASLDCENVLPLQPSTPYEFELTSFIRSRAGVPLGDDFVTRFYTAPAAGTAFHRALAEAYAPVIYQQIELARLDTFTDVYFDGNTNPNDNLEASRGANRGSLYWALTESNTHFFVTYLVYYAGRQLNDEAIAEHDMMGIQVIVEKTVSDPLGRLEAFTTFSRETLGRWALPQSYYPAGDLIADDGLDGRLDLRYLEGGRRVSIFIESGSHAMCIPNEGLDRCTPTTGATAPFEPARSRSVWRLGTTSQRIGDAADDALTYTLNSFVETFWVYRNRTSGANALFGGRIAYQPPETGPDILRPGDGLSFPSALQSDNDGDSFGDLPFAFGRSTAFPPDYGVWFVDPAWYTNEYFDAEGPIGQLYCYNPYLGVDVRDTAEGCTPSAFTLP